MTKSRRCPECGQPVIWLKTANGKDLPVDKEAGRGGAIVILPYGIALCLSNLEKIGVDPAKLHAVHWLSCRNSPRKPA